LKIPFVDLRANYLSIKEEIDAAIKNVIDNCAFIGGPYLEEFEENFAKKVGAKYCVGCSSGTSALQIAMKAHKLNEFVTPSNTFVATAEAGESLDIYANFIDVDEENGLMNLNDAVDMVGFCSDINGIVPVHLFGNVVDVDLLRQKLDNVKVENVTIIEDAAQAHFAKYNDGSYVGSKNTTCFSFFPGKCLGGFGDSGCLTTNNRDVYEFAKAFRDHGRKSKYESEIVGMNLRMDALQAAILNVKLKYILDWNTKRRSAARHYDQKLNKIKQIKILHKMCWEDPKYENQVFHLYVIRTDRRDELKKFLESNGVSCGVHYPIPIHCQGAYKNNNNRKLPITEMLSKQILSLPMYPELTEEQIEYICLKVGEFYQ
jgi:dTDP-4-amino-4,6-dideoxygalactose transaminase